MFCEECRAAVAIGRAREDALRDSSPPIAAPACRPSSRRATQNSCSMPRWSISIACARTMSRMVMTGRSSAVGLAGRRVGRGRTGRAHAAAEDVGADDEEAVGVDRLAGADHQLPPAGLAGDRIDVGDMLVAGQRMADQHGVGSCRRSACRRSGRRPGTARATRRRRAQRLVGAEARDGARRRHRLRCDARRALPTETAIGDIYGPMRSIQTPGSSKSRRVHAGEPPVSARSSQALKPLRFAFGLRASRETYDSVRLDRRAGPNSGRDAWHEADAGPPHATSPTCGARSTAIDAAMHGLLMDAGGSSTADRGQERRRMPASAFRPGREAGDDARAWPSATAASLPLDTVESIWRDHHLDLHVRAGALQVHADISGGDAPMRDTARFHFGFTVPYVAARRAPRRDRRGGRIGRRPRHVPRRARAPPARGGRALAGAGRAEDHRPPALRRAPGPPGRHAGLS